MLAGETLWLPKGVTSFGQFVAQDSPRLGFPDVTAANSDEPEGDDAPFLAGEFAAGADATRGLRRGSPA